MKLNKISYLSHLAEHLHLLFPLCAHIHLVAVLVGSSHIPSTSRGAKKRLAVTKLYCPSMYSTPAPPDDAAQDAWTQIVKTKQEARQNKETK